MHSRDLHIALGNSTAQVEGFIMHKVAINTEISIHLLLPRLLYREGGSNEYLLSCVLDDTIGLLDFPLQERKVHDF